MTTQPSKRQYACTICRRRRTKCDKQKPHCSQCEKLGFSHLCIYRTKKSREVEVEGTHLNPLEMELYAQNAILKNQIENKRKELQRIKRRSRKKRNQNDIKQTILKYDNNPENYDPIMSLTEKINSLNIEKDYTSHFGVTGRLSIITKDPILTQIYSSTDTNINNVSANKKKKVEPDPIYGPTVELQSILRRINEIIPSVDHCNIIVKYYWLYYDSILSVIDYEPFTTIFKNINSIIIDDNGIPRYRFRFSESQFKESYSEVISLATFMVILRIGYLTMPIAYNKEHNNSCLDPFFRPLLENSVSIGPEFCTLSLNLLSFIDTTTTESFSLLLLQYFLCLRFYRMLAPEDGDGDDGDESAVLFGQTVRLAIEMGINRDPEIYDPTGKIFDENFKYKWRKTWCIVAMFDALQALNLGRPLLLNSDYMDTKQIQYFHILDSSFYKNINSSSVAFNIKKLQNSAGMLNFLYDYTKNLSNGVCIWLNLKEKPRRSSIENIIVNILESLKNRFPSISETFKMHKKIDFTSNINGNTFLNKQIPNIDLIDNEDFQMNVLSNTHIILQLEIKCVLLSQLHFNFYLLFLNSDLKTEPKMCQHYLLQAEISACLLFYCCLGFYNLTYNESNNHYNFGMGVEARHLIVPQVVKYLYRLVPFIISLILRSQTKEFQSQLTLCNLYKSSPYTSSITVLSDIFNNNKPNSGSINIYSYLPNEVSDCLKRPLIEYFQEYYELLPRCPERIAVKSNDIYTVWNKMKVIYKKNDNGLGIDIPDIPVPSNHEVEKSIGASNGIINKNSLPMENGNENEDEILIENDNIIINNTFNPPNEDLYLSYTQNTNQPRSFSTEELMDISQLPDFYSNDLLYESLRYDSVLNDMLD